MPTVTRAKRAGATRRRARRPTEGLLYPLDVAYAQAGVAAPGVAEISAGEIPRPYRSLLVHENDMTLTLERYCGGRVALRTLSTFLRGPWYSRRVLLVEASSGRPVEMGAISVRLDAFSRKVQAGITRGVIPLGRVLRDGGVEFTSQPRAFLALTPNAEMMGVFWMREPRTLYGRRTEVIQDGKSIGDILEVLPPSDRTARNK